MNLIYNFVFVACLIIIIIDNFISIKEYLPFEIIYSLIAGLILYFIDYISRNFSMLKNVLIALIFYYDKEIRLSISYLFRIKIGDKYLLVKSRRIENQYQPVGGVIKQYSTSSKLFNSLDAKDDAHLPIDIHSKNDLRIRIKGKNFGEFIKWFNTRKDREICGWREFQEELINTEILSKQEFQTIDYRYLKTVSTKIRYSEYFNCNEFLMSEIYELLPNNNQEKKLQELSGINNNENYIFITDSEITQLGYMPSLKKQKYRVAPTSKWIL